MSDREKDSLGNRMKKYEGAYRISIPARLPVIIRVDGKAFHTYTKGCKRPFDESLCGVMNEVAQYLCKNIMNAKLAYVQSDEISILLVNYSDIGTQSWFDSTLQKMVSVSASMASGVFTSLSPKIFGNTKLALFDSRAFVVPKEDVCNYFLWRQQDATRNSVQMLARSLYSHKECNNKNNAELQEMCFQKGKNWNDMPTSFKRGRCIVKKESLKEAWGPNAGNMVVRKSWEVDNEIPIFSQDKSYIENYVYPQVYFDTETAHIKEGRVWHVNYGGPGMNAVGDGD